MFFTLFQITCTVLRGALFTRYCNTFLITFIKKLNQNQNESNNDTTFSKLQVKHPKPQEKTIKPNIIIDGLSSCSSVTSNEVYNAIMSSASGSAGGLDSLKSQHLKDLISDKLGLSSSNLLSSLAKIIDLMFRGLIPFEISQILYGDSLCVQLFYTEQVS
jgi:hypothetical protein